MPLSSDKTTISAESSLISLAAARIAVTSFVFFGFRGSLDESLARWMWKFQTPNLSRVCEIWSVVNFHLTHQKEGSLCRHSGSEVWHSDVG